MKTLHMMIGLPRSGKSTYAKLLGYPIVEPDAIRCVMHGSPWKANMEPMIWAIAKIMVESLFQSGHSDVILDAVNHTAARRTIWESEQWAIQHHVIDTDAKVCISRAIESGKEYLVPIINNMSRHFEPLGGSTDC